MRGLAILASGVVFAASCKANAPTAITLALSSEAPSAELPDVRLTVSRGGSIKLDRTYHLPETPMLPGTLVVTPSEGSSGPVTVVLQGIDAGGVRVERRARLNFVDQSSKLLRMRLSYGCFDVQCSGDSTCIDGGCQPIDTPAEALPEASGIDEAFSPRGCFDQDRCLTPAAPVALSLPDCSFLAPGPAGSFNVGALWKGADHVVLLPSTRWSLDGDRVTLGETACGAAKTGSLVALTTSSSCPTAPGDAVVCVAPRQGVDAGQGGSGGVAGAGGDAGAAGVSPVAGAGGDGGQANAGGIAGASGAGGLSGSAGVGGESGAAGAAGDAGTAGDGGAGGNPLCSEGQVASCAVALGSQGLCGTGSTICQAGAWGPCDVPPAAADGCFPPDDADCDGSVGVGCPTYGTSCGAGLVCAGGLSCCEQKLVPGGTFMAGEVGGAAQANEAPVHKGIVAPFFLDTFEITVGRARAFVAAYPASKPKAGAGAHPLIPGSGWDPSWDASLPADEAALRAFLACETNATWTESAGTNENRPANCMNWYLLFAFCAWDGGRLPTELELEFAVRGGDEQRAYPWGSAPPDATRANYGQMVGEATDVGSYPAGSARWGHHDLGGNVWEWIFDGYGPYTSETCDNCGPLPVVPPVRKGGSWYGGASFLRSAMRAAQSPTDHNAVLGGRCARSQ